MKKTALLAIALSPFLLNADQNVKEVECSSPYHVMHAGVRHTEARGVGYNDGYTTLEGFGIYNYNLSFMPFLDLRGHVFNNGKLAGNIGIGERTLIPSIEHLFGAYLYYDVRQENHHLTANQLSPGIELVGKRMEYRINGYFPVGNTRSHKYKFDFDRFKDNHILLHNKQKRVMTGGDAEVGVHITQSTHYDLYAAAGPYFFTAGDVSSWGGKTRLLGRYKEYVSLEASYSYDRLFHSVVQGSVAFTYPFGGKLRRKAQHCSQKNDLLLARASFAPYRFEIPVIKRVTERSKAINPATGKPWQVWFVSNTSHSAGTYESPFPTLLAAQTASGPNEMIYVFPGDGTTTGMNMGITLQNGQTLFGSGISHRIDTSRGKITLPAFSKSAPTLTNTASVITLASGNEVSGMNLILSVVDQIGIDGTSGIYGVTIDRNTIASAAADTVIAGGVNVLVGGSAVITNNTITGATISVPTPSEDPLIAVDVPAGQFARINISNNTLVGSGSGIQLGPDNVDPSIITGTCEALIAGNTISDFQQGGIVCSQGMADSPVRIVNNTISSSIQFIGAEIDVEVANLPNSGIFYIENNRISSTSPNPFIEGILVGGVGNTSVQVFINNNTIQMATTDNSTGIDLNVVGDGMGHPTMCASIIGNTIIGPLSPIGSAGITFSQNAGGSLFGTLNLADFYGNISPDFTIGGAVVLVPPNSCKP